MKQLYTTLLLFVTFITGNAQPATPDKSLQSFFSYLLVSGKLSIERTDSITVRTLANEAINAGFQVDTIGCTWLKKNMSKLYYTVTPEYVRHAGLIVAPKDSAYKARLGTALLKFVPQDIIFEHRLASFFPLNTNTGKSEYTLVAPVTACTTFTIKHYNTENLPWLVKYIDVNGYTQSVWMNASDTLFSFCGTQLNLMQDIDTINHVYAASIAEVSLQQGSCSIDPLTYFRPAAAYLEIEESGKNKPQRSNEMIAVKVLRNPSSSSFTLVTSATAPLELKVWDSQGRMIEARSASAASNLEFGSGYKPGIYYARVFRDGEMKTLSLIKQ